MRDVATTKGVETVFVATDLSAAADEAIRQGHARAQGGARLVVCHVVPRFSPMPGLSPEVDEPASVQFLEFRHRISEEVGRRTVEVTGRNTAEFDVLLEEGNAIPRSWPARRSAERTCSSSAAMERPVSPASFSEAWPTR